MKSILSKDFRYTPSAQSTPERLRAKFQKIIREQQQQKQKVVTPIRRNNGRS